MFPIFLKNGLNYKDSGCIYNLFLILQILLNNCLMKQKNSNKLIRDGKILCLLLRLPRLLLLFVKKKDFVIKSENLTKILNISKKNLINILNPKKKNLPDSISSLMMNYLKSSPKPKTPKKSNRILKKSLKISKPLNLIPATKSTPCFPLKKKKSPLLKS
jgi:hypothetical protein